MKMIGLTSIALVSVAGVLAADPAFACGGGCGVGGGGGGGVPIAAPPPYRPPSVDTRGGVGAGVDAGRNAADAARGGTNVATGGGYNPSGSGNGSGPNGGNDGTGYGGKAGGDASDDNWTDAPDDLRAIIAANNDGGPGIDIVDVDVDVDPIQIARGEGGTDPSAPRSDAGYGGMTQEEKIKKYQEQIQAKHSDWSEAKIRTNAEQVVKMVDDARARASNDPEYRAILESQRDKLRSGGTTGVSLSVKAIQAADKIQNDNQRQDKEQADAAKAAADAKADAKKAQDKADAATAADRAYRASQEYQDYSASKWSEGYDAKLKAWEQNNLTPVGGKLLTPDEVAALNTQNEAHYNATRSDQQRHDDLVSTGADNPADRPNGTKGFTPTAVVTTGQPRPVPPANYKPPAERTKVVRAGYE